MLECYFKRFFPWQAKVGPHSGTTHWVRACEESSHARSLNLQVERKKQNIASVEQHVHNNGNINKHVTADQNGVRGGHT